MFALVLAMGVTYCRKTSSLVASSFLSFVGYPAQLLRSIISILHLQHRAFQTHEKLNVLACR